MAASLCHCLIGSLQLNSSSLCKNIVFTFMAMLWKIHLRYITFFIFLYLITVFILLDYNVFNCIHSMCILNKFVTN